MNITSPLQHRSFTLLLAAVLLIAGLPAQAQTDPQANARISVLEARVDLELQTLQNRMNKAEAAAVDLREETRIGACKGSP